MKAMYTSVLKTFCVRMEPSIWKKRNIVSHRNHHHDTKVYPKFSGLSYNEINNKNKHSLRSNTKAYGGKTL
jgi:hypothetical protein